MGILKKLVKNKLGFLGLLILLLWFFSALFADWIMPYDPIALNIKDRLQGPTFNHFLGTDQLGRDVLSRVILGGRIALQVALPIIIGALFIGVIFGTIAGYANKKIDNIIVLTFDTLRSFPTVMFALAVVAIVGPSLGTIILVIMITSIPTYGRVARTQTLAIKHKEFIQAEKTMGASMFTILKEHVVPNIISPLLVLAAMDIPVVVGLEAGLSFLGMGVKPPTPSWGSILNDGYNLIRNTPWIIISGSIPLILVTIGCTFLGEALRDIIDPKTARRS